MDQTSDLVDRMKVKEAATALVAYHKIKKEAKEGKGTEVLFGDLPKVQLQLSVWKITAKKSKTHQIKLPHRPHAGSFDVCLFTKDEPKLDSDQSQMVYKDKLRTLGITSIDEVIPLKMMKKEYIPFEARRQLAKSYSLFLADNRIFRLLHSSLGKEFYKRNRYPVTVNLEKKDLKAELDGAVNSTYLIMSHRGSCSTVNVGNVGMSAEEITDNIMATMDRLRQVVPGGFPNIKSIFVRSEKSVSLPVYTSLVHEEWEQGEKETEGDKETKVDNSDIRKLKKQMRLQAEKKEEASSSGDDDDDDAPPPPAKTAVKRKKESGGKVATPGGKLAKKAKGGAAVAGVRKPTPKVGGKKKK